MPSREDIDRFMKVLDTVGAPTETLPEEASPEREGAAEEEALPEEGPPPDIGELLGSFEGLGSPPAPAETQQAAETSPEADEEFAGLDFGSLFGEESAAGPLEVIGEPETPAEGIEAQAPPEFVEPLLEAPQGFEEAAPAPPQGHGGPKAPEAALGGGARMDAPAPPDFVEPPSAGLEEESVIEPPLEPPAEPFFEPGPEAEGAEGMEMLPQDLGPLDELPPPSAGIETAEMPPAGEGGFELPIPETPRAPEAPETFPATPESLTGERIPPAPSESFTPESIELPSFEEMSLPEEEPAVPPQAPAGPEEMQPPAGLEPKEEALPGGEAPAEPQMVSLGEEATDELGLDEFTLPESVEEFGISQKPPAAAARKPAAAEARVRPGAKQEAIEELGEGEAEIALTEEQFARFKRCLDSLPRNLRMSIQDLVVGGIGSGADLKRLIDLLTAGAPPLEIATLAGKMSGKRIRLPAGFEKRTGIAFEAERRTFGYAFRENILPVVRVFALTAATLGLVIFLGYRFVYRPMYAYTNYRAGYDHLLGDRSQLANQRFASATATWPMKDWFYRYADGFSTQGRYILAVDKYEELLKRWPGDKKGIVDYARMMSTKLLDYKKANELLQRILDVKLYDYDALLASGDNDMEWAAEDPSRYEEARIAYASLIEKYGQKDETLFRMLRYFIRTDNYEEAERLRSYFAGREVKKVDAASYAELGGYLIDREELSFAQEVLFKAMEAQRDLPEIHYNLARYYYAVKDPAEEMKALQGALMSLKKPGPLSRSRIVMEIDSHTRLGELYNRNQEYLNAEKEFREAIRIVEDSQKRKLVGADKIFGLPYRGLGNLAYYVQGDLNAAYLEYQKAIGNGLKTPEMDYKIGYIHYAQEDYKAALDSFTDASEAVSPARIPLNLLYAAGSTFYQRADYFAAQGFFLRLSDILNDRRAGISNFQPMEQADHRSLVEYMLKVNNNLGVVLYRLSERMGDRRKRSQALAYLAAATEQYDVLSRDPETLRRPETRNLPSLNMRGILYPSSKFDPQIYRLIPKDLEALFF